MRKPIVLADKPEAVLTAWLERITVKGAQPGHVVGQIMPGDRFVWEVRGKPELAVLEGDIGIRQASPAEYNEVVDAIAKGQFQISQYNRGTDSTVIIHKATGLPLQPRRPELDDSPSP